MDEHVDEVRLRVEPEIPDVFEDHRFRDGTARVAQQQFEQRKLARLQLDGLARRA